MKSTFTIFRLFFLLISSTLSLATQRSEKGGGNNVVGESRFSGPGDGFNIPGSGPGCGKGGIGGGYGSGVRGTHGGYLKGGIIRPTVVFKDRGPCYKKKLTCPAKCFNSYSRAGKRRLHHSLQEEMHCLWLRR